MTPTLSVDGCHDSTADVPVTAASFTAVGALGAATSGHAEVETVVDVGSERLPPASNTSTPTV